MEYWTELGSNIDSWAIHIWKYELMKFQLRNKIIFFPTRIWNFARKVYMKYVKFYGKCQEFPFIISNASRRIFVQRTTTTYLQSKCAFQIWMSRQKKCLYITYANCHDNIKLTFSLKRCYWSSEQNYDNVTWNFDIVLHICSTLFVSCWNHCFH